MNRFLFITFILVGSLASAGGGEWQEVGSGGDVISCRVEFAGYPRNTLMMFDYYEAVVRYELSLELPYISELNALARAILLRIPNQVLRERSLNLLEVFWSEVEWKSSGLDNVRDVGVGFYDYDNCQVDQLILQRVPRGDDRGYYRIDQSLWNRVPEAQRAIAIVHEILYRQAGFSKVQESSEIVRYLVGLLLTKELGGLTTQEFAELLQRAGMRGDL